MRACVACMFRRPVGLLIAMLACLLVSTGAAGDGRQPLNEPALANLVLQDCGSCHGMTLRGGLGPPLRPADLERLSVDAIVALIREGVPGTAMPPWKELLSEPDIRWISTQLKAGTLIRSTDNP